MTDCNNKYIWSGNEWIDSELVSWGICADVLNQLCTDENYVYIVTSTGLIIADILTSNKVAYINIDGGFSTVWANTEKLYLGTANGIKYVEKACISTDPIDPHNLGVCLIDYDYQYNVSNNNVKYIHGFEDTLAVVTTVGIDVLRSTLYKSTFLSSGVTKCFITSKNELYYIIDGEVLGLYKINSVLCDWETPDIKYEVSKSFLQRGTSLLTDIFVTENTSTITNNNTLFVATSNGAYVYDEGSGVYEVYYHNTHI